MKVTPQALAAIFILSTWRIIQKFAIVFLAHEILVSINPDFKFITLLWMFAAYMIVFNIIMLQNPSQYVKENLSSDKYYGIRQYGLIWKIIITPQGYFVRIGFFIGDRKFYLILCY